MIPYTQAKRLTFKEVSGGGTSLTYQSLIMKTLPSTLDYSVGDLLSFDGMELYGVYSDGTDTFMKDVTDLATPSIAEGTEITENTPTTITFTYSEGGVTGTASYEIEIMSLPSGYTEKTYIQHSAVGTLELTLPKFQNGYKARMDISVPSLVYGGGYIATLSKSGSYHLSMRIANSPYKLDIIGDSKSVSFSNMDVLKERCIVELDTNGTLTVDGTEYDISTVTSTSALTETDILFGQVWSGGYWARTMIYGVKVFNSDGVMIANFIPCTNASNVAGLYDTVGKAFYNSSSWSTAG